MVMSTLTEKIRVMECFDNGGKVQSYSYSQRRWHDDEKPTWNWQNCEFRIKPEPLELWALLPAEGIGARHVCFTSSKKELTEQFNPEGYRVVKLREVVE